MSAPQYKYINKLQGKRVLVFGGTSGIGFGVVEAALEHGATVFITGSNSSKLEKTVERLTAAYPDLPTERISTRACDLADAANQETNIRALFGWVTDGGKIKLNHIVHSAGDRLNITPVSEITAEIMHKKFTVRLMTAMFIGKLAPKYLDWSANSSITFTSGVNSRKPSPTWSTTAASAGSLETFTRGLAVDFGPVRVNCVSPGAIHTELFAGIPQERLELYKQKTLVRKLGRPEDTAEAYSKIFLTQILRANRSLMVSCSLLHEGRFSDG
jgi:NAD(P)-dependent dehydrogenase (short-subunit alcohol dehydrogenase family)